MTPETRDRFAVLVERHLAGLLGPAEAEELSKLLEASAEARELYLRAMESHLDLGAAPAAKTPAGSRPAVPAFPAARKSPRILLLVSSAAALLLVAVLLRPANDGSSPPLPEKKSVSGPPPIDMPRGPTVSAPVDPRIEEQRRAIRALVERLNLAGIAGESLRLRGHAEAVDRLQERMMSWRSKIAESAAQLLELGQPFPVGEHLQPGDRLVAFAQKDFSTMPSSRIDLEILTPWLRDFRAGRPLEQAVVLRGSRRVELYLYFPSVTEELRELARLPEASGPGRYEGEPALPTLLSEIETRFQALPAGYRRFLPAAEVLRLDQVLGAKTATPEDQAFLRGRILGEALPGFEREAALVRAKAAELELKIKESTAVDIVHFKDGRKVSGQVLVASEQMVKIKARLGTLTVPMADVERIERGQGAGVEFPAKLAATPRTAPELSRLLEWCREKNLKLETEYVGCLILERDPSNEEARRVVGLGRPGIPREK